jgi:RNase P/RNase MRP subunit p30
MSNLKSSQTFANRARALARTAMKFSRKQRLTVVVSTAKTIDELRRELQNLSSGMNLQLSIKDCSPDLKEQLWSAFRRLSEEFGCSAEFRPDGQLWFVKRG